MRHRKPDPLSTSSPKQASSPAGKSPKSVSAPDAWRVARFALLTLIFIVALLFAVITLALFAVYYSTTRAPSSEALWDAKFTRNWSVRSTRASDGNPTFERPLNIAILCWGSTGDIRPAVALASAFQARGHKVLQIC